MTEASTQVASTRGPRDGNGDGQVNANARWGASSAQRARFMAFVYPVATMIVLIAIWELVVLIFKIKPFLLPSPADVWTATVHNRALLASNAGTTALEVGLGFLLSIVVGIPLAMAMVLSRAIERVMYPLLVTSQTVPKVAIAPLLIVWIGLGETPRILLAFVVAFFPIVIDTVAGLRSPDEEMIGMVRSMGATTSQVFLKIRVPSALPSVFSGFKVAIALAVVGATVAELVGGSNGLGYVILEAQGAFDTPLLFADVIVLSVLGLVLFYVVQAIEVVVLRRAHLSKTSEELEAGA